MHHLCDTARENGPDAEEDETTASRFVSRHIRWLVKGFLAKDKTVRYRAVNLIAEMIGVLGYIE